jgi:hypothetical protein
MSRFVGTFLLLLVMMGPTAARAQSARLLPAEPGIVADADERESGEPAEPEEEAEAEEIETDRDSFTPAFTVAGHRRTIVESAWSFIDNRDVADTHSFPELLTRIGWGDRLEFRLGWNYEVGGEGNSVSGGSGFGEPFEEGGIESESQVIYGIKSIVTTQSGWRPQSAVILQGGTPTSGPDNHSNFVGAYVWGWNLPNRWKWDTAIRYSVDADQRDHFNIWAPSTVLKRQLGERWNAHVEYFGIFTDGAERERVKHYISPGAHYLITPDWEMGVRLGWGLNEQAANFFANVGGGYRF